MLKRYIKKLLGILSPSEMLFRSSYDKTINNKTINNTCVGCKHDNKWNGFDYPCTICSRRYLDDHYETIEKEMYKNDSSKIN